MLADEVDYCSSTLQEYIDQYRDTPIAVSFRALTAHMDPPPLTHQIYPYPGRLLKQIPRFLLRCEQVSNNIDSTIDLFCGSGTVLLESQMSGINSIGVDNNPLALLLSSVKTRPPIADDFRTSAESILRKAKIARRKTQMPSYMEKWYSPASLSALGRIAQAILEEPMHIRDSASLLLLRTARELSIADPRIPVPVRSKYAAASPTDSRDVWRVWQQQTQWLGRIFSLSPPTNVRSNVHFADSRDFDIPSSTPSENDNLLLLTSPPYGAAQKYIRSSSLEIGWLGQSEDHGTSNLAKSSVGREKSYSRQLDLDRIGSYSTRLANILRTIERISPSRAHIYGTYFTDMALALQNAVAHCNRIILVAGTNYVAGTNVQTFEHLTDIMRVLGFRDKLVLVDSIRGRTLLTRRRGNSHPATSEYITIYERAS